MNRRSVLLSAVAWVLVVSVGATAVWWVISRAGAGVAGELPVPSTPAEAAAPAPAGSGTPSAASDSEPVTRSWRGDAGSVAASCSAGDVTLLRAQPASGWKAEVDDSGPDRVRVELETADERSRVRVEAVCRDGAPLFEADTRDKG